MTVDTLQSRDVEAEGEEDIFLVDGEYMDGDEEDIDFVNRGEELDEETNKFDQIIGALSDILLDPEFEELRESFCREHCKHFEEGDENKLIYTDIFSRYTELVEQGIEERLQAVLPGFDMPSFLLLLDAHKDELMSDVFDLLLTFSDFEAFREVMLAYKVDVAAGGPQGCGLHVQVMPLKVCVEEQSDGESRPDLDSALNISPMSCGANSRQPLPAHPVH